MIAKIAVSAATYAIDKPYSYKIPEGMTLQPGQRVQLPFGRANKRTEGVVLTVETGSEEKLKAVERCLDESPILSEHQLRLAAFLRERYFCTFYECLRVMLPAGLWFQARERISLTADRSWEEKTIRKDGAAEVLALLENLGGQAEEPALRTLIPDEEALSGVMPISRGRSGSPPRRNICAAPMTERRRSLPWRFPPRKPWSMPPAAPNPPSCREVCWS